MKLYLRLAWRNIWRHRRRTIIIMLAMGMSLAMMMWYDGLMEGFNQAIYGNAIRVLGGNIQIHAEGYRAKVDSNPLLPLTDDSAAVKAALSNSEVIAATRRIVTGGMATNREGAFSLEIIGIEPEAEQLDQLDRATCRGRTLARCGRSGFRSSLGADLRM